MISSLHPITAIDNVRKQLHLCLVRAGAHAGSDIHGRCFHPCTDGLGLTRWNEKGTRGGGGGRRRRRRRRTNRKKERGEGLPFSTAKPPFFRISATVTAVEIASPKADTLTAPCVAKILCEFANVHDDPVSVLGVLS